MVLCEDPLGRVVEGRIGLRTSRARVLLAGAPWLDQAGRTIELIEKGRLGRMDEWMTGGDGMKRKRRKPTKAE
jgi:hypothetical protein